MDVQHERLYDLEVSDLVKIIIESNIILNKFYEENQLLDKRNKNLILQNEKNSNAINDSILYINSIKDKVAIDKASTLKYNELLSSLKNCSRHVDTACIEKNLEI